MFKRQILEIFNAALSAADPANAIAGVLLREKNNLVALEGPKSRISYDLSKFDSVKIVGFGKASVPMAAAAEKILGGQIRDGLVITKHGHAAGPNLPSTVRIAEAAHPIPDSSGVKASREIAGILEHAGEKDLIIALLSGGGTSLYTSPVTSVSLDALGSTSRLLLACGADIHEMNTVRKHLSKVQGGNSARLAYPAHVLVLVLSDVIGDDLDTIASGPFFPDRSTFRNAWDILGKFHLIDSVPGSVRSFLQSGMQGTSGETPKQGDVIFNAVNHIICGSNQTAQCAAVKQAAKLGFTTVHIGEPIAGFAAEAGKWFARKAIGLRQTSAPVCIIGGGETTVHLGENYGIGGRNQEFALAAAVELDGISDIMIMSCSTDGGDGPTDAAGAVVDGSSVEQCRELGLNHTEALARHNAYPLLEKIGALVKTGPTFTNVTDIQVAIVGGG